MRGLFAFLIALVFGMDTAALASEMVVLSSSYAHFTPGQIINDDDGIALPEGTRLSLITMSGDSLVLEGPFTGTPGKDSPPSDDAYDVVSILSKFISSGGIDTTRLAVTRSKDRRGSLQINPMAIDARRNGRQCVSSDSDIMIWRTGTLEGSRLIIRKEGSGKETIVLWPKSKDGISWPADIPFADGESYSFAVVGAVQTSITELSLLPASLITVGEKAAWMAENGCEHQALLLLRSIN